VLTGGGDVPGLNAVLQTLAERLTGAGCELLGLRRGWAALLNVRPGEPSGESEWVLPLDRRRTRRIESSGGTLLHTSRLDPSRLTLHQVPEPLREGLGSADREGAFDLTPRVLEAIDFLRLDAIVAVGGDGTLSYALRLHREGVPVIAVPKTMDNDVHGTDYAIGFSTAVSRSVRFIEELRTTAGSHERVLIVELFGRYSGEPCLLTSYLASVDRALIAEVPYEEERIAELILRDRLQSPSRYAILTVAEGAHPRGGQPLERGEADAAGHRKVGGIGALLADRLEEISGERAAYQPLGYLMRSGPPDVLDLLVAKNFAGLAAGLLLAGESGRMVAVAGGRYTAVSIERLGEGTRRVDVERFYDREQYRPRIEDVRNLPMFLH
jgi:ATP-dependent phosphofructokinase / diphosphate-dependent phosphofructokinase